MATVTAPTTVPTKVEYRWLTGVDLELLAPKIAEQGWTPLNPVAARALAAFSEDGSLLGFQVFQLLTHAEPQFVELQHRGAGIADEMAKQVGDYLKQHGLPFEVTAGNAHAAKLCEANGMKLVHVPVYRWYGNEEG